MASNKRQSPDPTDDALLDAYNGLNSFKTCRTVDQVAAGCRRMSVVHGQTNDNAAALATNANAAACLPDLHQIASRYVATEHLSSTERSSHVHWWKHAEPSIIEAAALSASTVVLATAGRAGGFRLRAENELSDKPSPKRRCSNGVDKCLLPGEEVASGVQQHPCSYILSSAEAQDHIKVVAGLKAKTKALARAAKRERRHRLQVEKELEAARQQSQELQLEVGQMRLKIARAHSDAMDGMVQLVESHLQCCICLELMVQAKSLRCSHSFCSHCIDKWLEKKQECPVCRVRFTGRASLSYVLDSYIDKVVELMSEEKRASRRELVDQRKAEQDAAFSKGKKKPERIHGGASAATRVATAERSAGRRNGAGSVSAATASTSERLVSEQQLPSWLLRTTQLMRERLPRRFHTLAQSLRQRGIPDNTVGNPFGPAPQTRASPEADADDTGSQSPGVAATANTFHGAAAPDALSFVAPARPRAAHTQPQSLETAARGCFSRSRGESDSDQHDLPRTYSCGNSSCYACVNHGH